MPPKSVPPPAEAKPSQAGMAAAAKAFLAKLIMDLKHFFAVPNDTGFKHWPVRAKLAGLCTLFVLVALILFISLGGEDKQDKKNEAKGQRVVIALSPNATSTGAGTGTGAKTAVSDLAAAGSSLMPALKKDAPADLDVPEVLKQEVGAALPLVTRDIGLPPAPDPQLVQNTKQGSLPKIAEDGRRAWQVYARSFSAGGAAPRLAIVVAGLGISAITTDLAIETLPSDVTLAFLAGAERTPAWMSRARARGHETLLDIPMEPFDYPRNDPGAQALLLGLSPVSLLERLYASLRQGIGYFGVTTLSGSAFSAQPEKMRGILAELNRRGLAFFDAKAAPRSVAADVAAKLGMPNATANLRLDGSDAPQHFIGHLESLAGMAKSEGQAIGVLYNPSPLALNLLAEWVQALRGQGILLVPTSSLMQKPRLAGSAAKAAQ